MFLVDFAEGRIVKDEELKASVAARNPYAEWLTEQRIDLSELPEAASPDQYAEDDLLAALPLHADRALAPDVQHVARRDADAGRADVPATDDGRHALPARGRLLDDAHEPVERLPTIAAVLDLVGARRTPGRGRC